LCVPAERDDTSSAAWFGARPGWLAVGPSGAVPRFWPLLLWSKKLTVPVGVPEPGELTVTVAGSVTGAPAVGGFGEDVCVVVVPALITVSGKVLERPGVQFVSPLYWACSVCGLPAAVKLLVSVAMPLVTGTVPSRLLPSRKSIVPLGVKPGQVT